MVDRGTSFIVGLALAFAAVLALTGCAVTWERPGATQADFNRDAYECERDARQSGYYGGGLVGALNMQAFGDRCMVARGYHKKSQ